MFFLLFALLEALSARVFFNDTATTEIYPLSLHDALPICGTQERVHAGAALDGAADDGAVLDGEPVRAVLVHPPVQRLAIEQGSPPRIPRRGAGRGRGGRGVVGLGERKGDDRISRPGGVLTAASGGDGDVF